MKLSKLEQDGTKIPKVFKPSTNKKPIEQELEEIKELLHTILKKLNEKS